MKGNKLTQTQIADVVASDPNRSVQQAHRGQIFHDLRNSVSILKNNLSYMAECQNSYQSLVLTVHAVLSELQVKGDLSKEFQDIRKRLQEVCRSTEPLLMIEEIKSAVHDCQNDTDRIEANLKLLEKL